MSALHQTVLLNEAVTALNIDPHGVYVDCTFGRGGHAQLILSKLSERGRLIAFDKDSDAVKAAHELNDQRLYVVHSSFVEFAPVLARLAYSTVDGVVMDLGVSSPQLDEAERGFSFRFDAPLDMRMDRTRGPTASEWLNRASQTEIAGVIKDYGEERFAKQIAASIITHRLKEPITTTRQLANIVAAAVRTREPGQNPATRTFQAIRIFINRELEELSLTLPQILRFLRPGSGRLVVITFHSLEDRIVKRFMTAYATADSLPSRLPVKVVDIAKAPLHIIGKPIRPSAVEVAANPRARSALLRVAARSTEALH